MIIARRKGKACYEAVDDVRELKVGMMVRTGTEWSQVTCIIEPDDVIVTTKILTLHISAIDEVLPMQKWLAKMSKCLDPFVKLTIVPRED